MAIKFEVLLAAGMTAGDLANIVEIPLPHGGVKSISRTTAFNWSRGKSQPMDYTYTHIASVVSAIEKAVTEKKLPLALNTKRKDRINLLKQIINRCM